MRLLISTKAKKIYFFEIFLVLLLLASIVFIVVNLTNPELKKKENNDSLRKAHLEVLSNVVKEYIINSEEQLDEVSECLNGFTQIGKGTGEFDLHQAVNNQKDSLPKDPSAQGNSSGYEICRSTDSNIYMFKAPLSELEPDISLILKIN